MKFAIAYMTNRRNPHFDWFLQSLSRQCVPADQPVIIVDFYADEPGRKEAVLELNCGFNITHVTPKPSLWQGKHKITKGECFDAGNARNTALCLAREMYIAWVDDVSVLTQNWYSRALTATTRNAITLGSYRKVFNLEVNNGLITGLTDNPRGHDSRRRDVRNLTKIVECDPRWLFGCSLVAPVETMLDLGGWPESLCAGTGYEDVIMALVARNNRIKTYFDPMMMTIESEEAHGVDSPFLRWDPCKGDPNAKPRDDKSHAMIRIALAWKRTDNGYDIRELRNRVLSGGEFPVPTEPVAEWFTGTKLDEILFL